MYPQVNGSTKTISDGRYLSLKYTIIECKFIQITLFKEPKYKDKGGFKENLLNTVVLADFCPISFKIWIMDT